MSANVVIYCSNVAGQWTRSLKYCARVFSPYITSFLAEKALDAALPRWIEVYTRFEIEAFAAGASSLPTLKKLSQKGYQLYHVPLLHAKVFEHPTKGFATIGSQNLTRQGTLNREATVLIREPALLKSLSNQLARWTEERLPITMEMILEAEKAVDLLRKEFQSLQRTCRQLDRQIFSAQSERYDQNLRFQRARLLAVLSAQSVHLLDAQRETELRIYQQERQKRLYKMGDGTTVTEIFCRIIARRATEHNIQGPFHRAEHDADHLRKGPLGWEIPLGANRFGVELAVKKCRRQLDKMFPSDVPRPFVLTAAQVKRLQFCVSCSIIDYRGKPYDTKYRVIEGRMKLGNHWVNLAYTVEAILFFSGFKGPA